MTGRIKSRVAALALAAAMGLGLAGGVAWADGDAAAAPQGTPPGTPPGMPYHGAMHGMPGGMPGMQSGDGPWAFHKCAREAMTGDQKEIGQKMKACSDKHSMPHYGSTAAQQQPWAGQKHPQGAPTSTINRAEMMKKRMEMVKKQLQITEAQEGAWNGFVAAITGRMDGRKAKFEFMKEMAGKSQLERMEAQLTRMEERLQGKRKIFDAYRKLDGLMSAPQKQQAGRYLSRYTMMGGHGGQGGPMGGPGGPMGGHGGPGSYGGPGGMMAPHQMPGMPPQHPGAKAPEGAQ